MKENITEIKQSIQSLIELNYLPAIRARLKKQRQFAEKSKTEFIKLQSLIDSNEIASKSELISKAVGINNGIKKLVSEHFEKDTIDNLTEAYPDFINALNLFVSETSEIVVRVQDEERFISKPDDKLSIKLRKPLKKFFYNVSNFPIAFSNIFRKLFKKQLKEKKFWKRKIQLRKLRQYYFYYLLNTRLLEITKNYYQQRSRTAKKLWEIYEALDSNISQKYFPDNGENEINKDLLEIIPQFSEIQNELKQFEDSLIPDVHNILEPLLNEYNEKYLKSGTIEFPKRKLSNRILRKKEKQLNNLFKSTVNGWENNFTALGDDWQMNNEIYLLRYNSYIQQELQKLQYERSIKNNVSPKLDEVILSVKKMGELLSTTDSKSDLYKKYSDIKNKIKNQLTDSLIPDLSNSLIDQNLPGIIAEFDNVLQEQINGVKNNRLLVKTDEYDKEIKNSEINTFSPKEILEYSAAPKFFTTTSKLKSSINNQVQQIHNDLSEIDHITDFTIDSAINKLELDKNVEESKVIAVEGIDRALNKLNEINEKFNDILLRFDNEINKASHEFNSELRNLTLTEKIFDIKLSLAKAKAVQRSKQVRKEFIENSKNVVPQIFNLSKKLVQKIKDQYQKIRGLFGLAPSTKVIASEVSDYLAETQSAILRLPFVYQRLFEVKPLDDERFFFGRENELKELDKALSNWKKEKFAPTIIIGEKGSGSTSLINNYVAKNLKDFEVIRYSVLYPISDTSSFIKFLNEILKVDNLKTLDDFVSYFNNLTEKKIVIIENLQRIFLRKVDGFKVLKMYFELISKTNKNVFWLSTCTLYSWNYLNQTIHAGDYLGYIINLRKLNEEQITDLVSKRHRVSGYNIHYVADENELKSKSYKKLSDEEKQIHLRKKYFAELNKFAQSNISLALIFWLRSAQEIVNDVIKIGSPPDLDYSFLENLSNEKVFALSALLIHDGLEVEDHSKIFNVPLNRSNLLFLLMRDDGIIVQHDKLYIINPLLYRQIVGLLKSKNIIH